MIAKYSLQGLQKPIGLATYQLMPEHLREALPNPAQLEMELEGLEEIKSATAVAEIGPGTAGVP